MNSELIITLIFAAIAGFVLFKLRSVLGRRTGHEQQRDPFGRREQAPGRDANGRDNVVTLPDRGAGPAGDDAADAAATPLDADINRIRMADRNFEPSSFLGGAKAAFELIVLAYAKGDLETVRPFVAPDVFDSFNEGVKDREEEGEILETKLFSIRSADITAAEMRGREARVTVTFVSEQNNVIRNKEGVIVDGDTTSREVVTDVWTFARDTRSDDPNWTLVETGADD